jgi:hypothetical protein
MSRWLLFLVLHIIAWALNWFIAPVYSLFTANGWPARDKWILTPDNLSCGDRQFMREGAPFIGMGHKGIKAWINRTAWLYRNPMMGFAVEVLGFKPSEIDRCYSVGNPLVGDKRKVEGLFSQEVVRGLDEAAFQHYFIYAYNEKYCFRARLGWKLSSWPNPKNGGKYQFVCALTPVKKYG